MKKEVKTVLIYIFIMVVVVLLGSWALNSVDKNLKEVYNAGYSKGYQVAIDLKIADYKYWCEDKYGWIPKEAVNENDYCSWLSEIENRYYGDFYGDCFGWQQDQWYKMGQELK